MANSSWCRRVAVLAFVAASAAFAAGPVHAEKLIVFKNGKTIRAKSIKQEKGWSRLELEGGNLVGVRTPLILSVEEASGGPAGKAESVPNQASVGGAGGGGGFSAAPQAYSPRGGEEPSEAADDSQQGQQEGQPPPQPQQPVVSVPGIPNLSGVRPVGQQPFGNRLGRRGQPGGVPPGTPRLPVTTSTNSRNRATPSNPDQNNDDD